MSIIHTPVSLRWERAKSIPDSAVEIIEKKAKKGVTTAKAFVQTHEDGSGYLSVVEMNGKLIGTNCTCADWRKMNALYFDLAQSCNVDGRDPKPEEVQGIPLLHGVLVCKHVLKVANLCKHTA